MNVQQGASINLTVACCLIYVIYLGFIGITRPSCDQLLGPEFVRTMNPFTLYIAPDNAEPACCGHCVLSRCLWEGRRVILSPMRHHSFHFHVNCLTGRSVTTNDSAKLCSPQTLGRMSISAQCQHTQKLKLYMKLY